MNSPAPVKRLAQSPLQRATQTTTSTTTTTLRPRCPPPLKHHHLIDQSSTPRRTALLATARPANPVPVPAHAISGPPTPTRPIPPSALPACSTPRLNVSLMSPVAAHSGTTVPAHLNQDAPAKGSPHADHDAHHNHDASPTGSRPVPRYPVETTSTVAPPSPSRFAQSDQRRTRTTPNNIPTYDPSAAVQAGRELQHAVEPLLSERDSIFATHYTGGDAPVPALKERKAEREEDEQTRDDHSDMAIPMPTQAFMGS